MDFTIRHLSVGHPVFTRFPCKSELVAHFGTPWPRLILYFLSVDPYHSPSTI